MNDSDNQPKDTAVFRSCFLILVVLILLGIVSIFTKILSDVLGIQFWCVLPIVGPVVLYVGINEAYKWIRRSGPNSEPASGDKK